VCFHRLVVTPKADADAAATAAAAMMANDLNLM
jgi:hypothetical protein